MAEEKITFFKNFIERNHEQWINMAPMSKVYQYKGWCDCLLTLNNDDEANLDKDDMRYLAKVFLTFIITANRLLIKKDGSDKKHEKKPQYYEVNEWINKTYFDESLFERKILSRTDHYTLHFYLLYKRRDTITFEDLNKEYLKCRNWFTTMKHLGIIQTRPMKEEKCQCDGCSLTKTNDFCFVSKFRKFLSTYKNMDEATRNEFCKGMKEYLDYKIRATNEDRQEEEKENGSDADDDNVEGTSSDLNEELEGLSIGDRQEDNVEGAP